MRRYRFHRTTFRAGFFRRFHGRSHGIYTPRKKLSFKPKWLIRYVRSRAIVPKTVAAENAQLVLLRLSDNVMVLPFEKQPSRIYRCRERVAAVFAARMSRSTAY
jgi:hypothetical protein